MKIPLTAAALLAALPAFAELNVALSASPQHPIAGDTITWKVHMLDTDSGRHGESDQDGVKKYQYVWNVGYTPWPYIGYPGTETITNSFDSARDVTATVTVSDGADYVQRALTVHVSETEIKLVSPTPQSVWRVGGTYEIKWETRGVVTNVQIGLYDFRYPTETGNTGFNVLAQSIANTGSFLYTVPPPNPDGISAGNLGGRNYWIVVYPWNDGVDGWNKYPFTIEPSLVVHHSRY